MPSLIQELTELPDYEDQVAHVEVTDARGARYGKLESDLHPSVRAILGDLGIDRLYSHQAEGVDAALNGENTCVVAATAGGGETTSRSSPLPRC